MTRRRGALVWAVALVAGGAYSLVLGQDVNGDQRNNHAYAVWRLFHHQQDIAWGVGGVAGYLPAAWDVPWYFAALHLSAPVTVFLLGALHAVAAVLAVWVVWSLLAAAPERGRLVLTVLAGAVSLSSPAYLAELGTTYGNVVTAIPVLAAVLVVVRRPARDLGLVRALVVGLLLGVAFGLKLTNGPFVLAGLVGLLVIGVHSVAGLRAFLVAAAGSVVGTAVSGGAWFAFMQQRFGNPLFPFYNAVFHSPYGPDANVKDANFGVDGWGEALRLPFRMATSGGYPSELTGRDDRWVVVVALVAVALVAVAVRRGAGEQWVRGADRAFVLTFCVVGFVLWDAVFAIARYLLPLELLAGAAVVCLVDLVARSLAVRVAATAVVAVLVLPWVVVPRFAHISPWHRTWFAYSVPDVARQPDLLVVLPTSDIASYLLPALPSDVRAVQAPHVYPAGTYPAGVTGKEDEDVRRVIEGHSGPVVSITTADHVGVAGEVASSYGFTLDPSRCSQISGLRTAYQVCPWSRATT